MSEKTSVRINKSTLTNEFIQQIIDTARLKFSVPAIAITMIDTDDIFIKSLQGTRIYERDDSATLNDYFHIGSCSKSVLATIAGKLIEEGNLQWQTRFLDVFPELKEHANVHFQDVTLEDLFLCEAGIKAYTSSTEKFPNIDDSSENRRLEFVKYLIQQPPASKQKKIRGFHHLYSNASYTVASAMLERLTGKDYEELITHYICNELKNNTHFGWANSFNDSQPWGHIISGKSVHKFEPGNAYKLPDLLAPAGDLSMSPIDFAKYIQLHLRGLRGQDNFIKSNTYQYIHFSHKGFSIGVTNGTFKGLLISGMDGSAGTFFCRAIIVPYADLAFTIMMNAGSGTAHMKAVDWLTMQIANRFNPPWWKIW